MAKTKDIIHTNTKKDVSIRGKNLRLSFEAWQAIRHLKFEEQADTYSDVLKKVFDAFEKKSIDPQNKITHKLPQDQGDPNKLMKSDKTIVVSSDIHERLNRIKTQYMLDKGISARGPNSISISDIVIDLINHYRQMKGGHR